MRAANTHLLKNDQKFKIEEKSLQKDTTLSARTAAERISKQPYS